MKLSELEPKFIRRELRKCLGGKDVACSIVHDTPEIHEYHMRVDALADADGIVFQCPKCKSEQPNGIGVHYVICWRPRVPGDVDPKPGRWEFIGTGLEDLTLVAGSSSILLTSGCQAHFFIRNGNIE